MSNRRFLKSLSPLMFNGYKLILHYHQVRFNPDLSIFLEISTKQILKKEKLPSPCFSSTVKYKEITIFKAIFNCSECFVLMNVNRKVILHIIKQHRSTYILLKSYVKHVKKFLKATLNLCTFAQILFTLFHFSV